jgi:hypothetical protein
MAQQYPEYPEGAGGGKGYRGQTASTLRREASLRVCGASPGIPPKKTVRRKRCRGGQPNCKNYIGDYKDVENVGCCEQCDKYIDENPYDPYWEHMDIDFESSEEYKELKEKNLLEDSDAYEKAFEKFRDRYEPWPIMRRRMA